MEAQRKKRLVQLVLGASTEKKWREHTGRKPGEPHRGREIQPGAGGVPRKHSVNGPTAARERPER